MLARSQRPRLGHVIDQHVKRLGVGKRALAVVGHGAYAVLK